MPLSLDPFSQRRIHLYSLLSRDHGHDLLWDITIRDVLDGPDHSAFLGLRILQQLIQQLLLLATGSPHDGEQLFQFLD